MFKKSILALAALGCMAFATSAFAVESTGLYRDASGDLHYKMCAHGQSVINEQDITSDLYWIVPAKVLSMKSTVRPVHNLLQITEEEFAVYNGGQGGKMPDRHIKADAYTVPIGEIYAFSNPELWYMDGIEFHQWFDRNIGGGN